MSHRTGETRPTFYSTGATRALGVSPVQQKLQQAQSEIRQQKAELQDKLEELEQLKNQISTLQGQVTSGHLEK
jgi:peptidoglycan hydrolase CwlO-like protein